MFLFIIYLLSALSENHCRLSLSWNLPYYTTFRVYRDKRSHCTKRPFRHVVRVAQRYNIPIFAVSFNLNMRTDYPVIHVSASYFMTRGRCPSGLDLPKRFPRRVTFGSYLGGTLNVSNCLYRHLSNRPPFSLRPYCSPSLGLSR